MGLFGNKHDGDDKWKTKYFDLLIEQESFEKEQQGLRDLFCKTLVRFALAVKGFDSGLDPHLERLRKSLKAGIANPLLQQELEAFSKALYSLKDLQQTSHLDAGLLFEYLIQTHVELESALQRIQASYQNREIPNQQQLFLALADLLKNVGASDALQNVMADNRTVGEQLLNLLDNVQLPPAFAQDAANLRVRLNQLQPLAPIFDDGVRLLLSVKKHIDVEQQEMATFLTRLTDELTDLGIKTAGMGVAAEDSFIKHSDFNRTVEAQIVELQQNSASATQLEPLKQLIELRVHTLNQQLQQSRAQEEAERTNAQQQLNALVQKLQALEEETSELRSHLDVAQYKATRDPLTELSNRLALDERLASELARCKRYGGALSVAVFDIDYFKNINDTYGHKSGDKVLIIIAKLLSQHSRETDFLARFGGEEFVMLLPETGAEAAFGVVEKIRQIVENSGFNAGGNPISITLSCGLTEYVAGDDNESIFSRADAALYQAKQQGRNCCVPA